MAKFYGDRWSVRRGTATGNRLILQGYKLDYGIDMSKASPTKGGALYQNDVVMPLIGSGAPTDGTSGTGAGDAGPGSIYIDYTNAKAYINGNTKASPTWKIFTSAS